MNTNLILQLLKRKVQLLPFVLFSYGVIFNSCTESKSRSVEETQPKKIRHIENKNRVGVMVLELGNFEQEMVSNGKLRAFRKSTLKFVVGGQLKSINARNGMHVSRNRLLAVVDQFEYEQKLDAARTAFANATLDLEDLLLARGIALSDTVKSKDIYGRLRIRSGYANAKRDLKTARYNLSNTELYSPFAGKVANIKGNAHEHVAPGQEFCTIIDDSEFEVEFSLMETEIKNLKLNDIVTVIPFSRGIKVFGSVSAINPFIDEHGLVLVRAIVKNVDEELMEGMNVTVAIKRTVPNQLVVPKSAVVLRQNQEVIFKYRNGRAVWTYVNTLFENSGTYSIVANAEKEGSINAGDTVIWSGNINLAHDTEVELL